MSFIWEFYQHGKVIGASADAKQALSKAYESGSQVSSIERKLDRAVLLNQAIWSLIKQQTSLTETDLMQEIRRIDMLDGQLDGKSAETKKCNKCSTILAASAVTCYQCGAKNSVDSAFHSL